VGTPASASGPEGALPAGASVTVHLTRHGDARLTYPMTVVADDGDHLVVEGPMAEPHARDLGYVRLDVDDWFLEHYWRSAWYSVKEIRGRAGRKGWYCDVARPAVVRDGHVYSDDLELDVWVAADFSQVLVLDEDEFEASGIANDDPAVGRRAREAVEILVQLASQRQDVFAT
jgi:hypothetical protein